jgi:hypothetical protein
MGAKDPPWRWRVHLYRLVGDHSRRHVHVYRDGKLVVKWDLDSWQAMKGHTTARITRILRELVEEGTL